ncbi:hypothetical protein KPL70_021529 [Citrus sinensis]|nr:hypothetical protein KPL70_021529 [Citrus sinensis]
MTSRREWFYTYKPISGGSVYMGDDNALEIVSVGTIKIKIFDGTIHTIEEVRHVKSLKINLLSLGQIDNLGCKTHVENGIRNIVKGIQRQFTVAYTPQQNKVVERMNRTLIEIIRAMLKTVGLPNSFWVEAVKTVCYIVNRSPSTTIELKTPAKISTGKPADHSYLNAFGCYMYVMYNAQERTKLDTKSRRCIFLGYTNGVNGYRLWNPTAQKIFISRGVIFVEEKINCK